MFKIILLGFVGFFTGSTDAHADTGEVETVPSAATIAPAKPATQADTTRTKAKKKRARAPEREVPFVERHHRELLGLLGLLILWLLTRIFGQEEPKTRRPSKRHSPLTAEEFARVVFSVIRGENVSEYRGLYLTGAESVHIMGDQAAHAYLEQRTSDVFDLAFDTLFDQVPAQSTFEKGHLDEKDCVELWVIDKHNHRHRIPIGQIVHIGAILRLVSPAMGAKGTPKIEPLEPILSE